jgi:hypothetical protein
MCTVLLPPGDNPIAVNKYIIISNLHEFSFVLNPQIWSKTSPNRSSLHTTFLRYQSSLHLCPYSIKEHNPQINKITTIYVMMSVSGVHFPTNDEHLLTELSKAVRVFLEGLEQLSLDEGNEVVLSPHLSCDGRGEARWRKGDKFFRSVK